MMFSGSKAAHGLFRWKWRGESSITTGLLDDVPPEIELSDYHRAPSAGSESPSGLLNGESFSGEPIADLDLFFERLYSYHCEKGLWCIIIKWILELLGLAFTTFFSAFFLLIVDWNGLRNAKCGMDAVESGIKPCDLSKEALHRHPLTPFTVSKAIVVGYLGIFSIYWIFCFLRFFAQLKDTLKIRDFYYNSLHVTDNEIQTMPWASILEKIVQLQNSQQLCVVKDLSIQDVVMRLMRKENYLIGMVNKGVLAFPISPWVPGVGPVKFSLNGLQHRLMLTKTLEWTLNWCVLQSMFDRNYCVRRDFVSDPKTLKKRLMIVGIAMLFLSPFLVIFMLVYLFLRHAEQFYNHPSTASSRRWSTLAKWMFREYNEVDHLFKHRITSSIVHASDYLKQFPSPIISLIAKFISFVSGGFAAVLIIIAFLDESLLEGHIFGRNLLWYGAVFGAITAISRAAITDELLVLNPHEAMSLVVQHTHYMPKRWRGKEQTEGVRLEFETLFQYTGMMLLEEMASIFVTPYLLLFVVPKRVDAILQFITDFTVDVEGVGHVCSFSAFDFRNHGNSKYGSPFNAPRTQRSSQGKMEKSFLSFHTSYLSSEPNADGKEFLSRLKAFREQKLRGQEIRPAYPTSRFQPWNLNFRGSSDRNPYFSREMNIDNLGGGYELDSMWLMAGEQRSCPYILDWYYTSCPHDMTDGPRGTQHDQFDVGEESLEDAWKRSNSLQNKLGDENWGHTFDDDDDDRTRSHLDASTSAPLFRESSVLQQHDNNNLAHSAKRGWWARSRPQVRDPQTSFLEPSAFFNRGGTQASFLEPPPFINRGPQTSFLEPTASTHHPQTSFVEPPSTFNRHPQASFVEPPPTSNRYPQDNYDTSPDTSVDEQGNLDLRNSNRLTRTFFMDESGGDFNLPFDDIYGRRSASSSRRSSDDAADLV
ncbi:autophagy-related protein 9 [Ipomoea triloba]|uniref:autophagy-related protein 9 n=1 Tax=Ipomoea triloba TaxID=35885 RepID=UPI00125DA218|nr:autophagy-related protein 9 [Ipomoea triloba]